MADRIWESYLISDCIVPKEQMKRLGEHKYSAVDTSWLDELCMKKFWDKVVTFCPMWVAPNLITLVGLIINLCTVLVLSFYCPTATESAPSWVYFQAALGLFLYQTLDAIDGKQARRTGSSSPLGELFDHGCDSASQVFVTLNICYAMTLGAVPNGVFAISVVSIIMFYAAHWSTYCTGQLRFSKFDVTEAQWMVISVLVFTGIFGAGTWSANIIFGLQLRYLVVGGSLIMSIVQIGGYAKTILGGGVGKNGSTVAGTSVLFPLLPLLMVLLPFAMIYSKATTSVYDVHVTLFILCFGAVGSKTTNRLVIAHMSKSELPLWDWAYLAPIAMILNQYYDCPINEYHLLIVATIYVHISLAIFCTYVTRQFCHHLNIYCFKLGPRASTGRKQH